MKIQVKAKIIIAAKKIGLKYFACHAKMKSSSKEKAFSLFCQREILTIFIYICEKYNNNITDMERYTINNLPANPAEDYEDIRLKPAKNRMIFLWCAIRSNILQNAAMISKIALVIVLIGIVAMLVFDRPWKALTLMAILTLAYGKFLWGTNKLYSSLRRGNCFPVLTSEGPQNIMDINKGEQYIRIESAPWQKVESISFYSSFLLIEMKDESESGFFYMWTDDMKKAKQTALSMWRKALELKEKNTARPEYYSETELAEVSNFIEDKFGSYDYVIHEIASPDIHVDIAIIPPTEERNYYTLCTMGVGAHRMNVPDQLRYEYHLAERAELLIYLPVDWDLSEEGFKDERNYWPVRLLKDFARMPFNTDSWIAWGHSLSQQDNKPFAEGVPYSGSLLLCPQPDIFYLPLLSLSTGKSVDFFQVFPLTSEEMEYKLRCANDEECEDSPTDAMLNHFEMDREHWMEYVMNRFNYRKDA